MMNQVHRVLFSVVLAAVCLLSAAPARAQGGAGKVAIGRNGVEAKTLASPEYGARRTANAARAGEEWLQFQVEYRTMNGSGKDTKGDKGWQDEVVVEWNILIKRKDDKEILLKRTVTYIDVEDKRGSHFADLYLRPAFFRRYCKGVNPRDILYRVQIKINGKTEDTYRSDHENVRWWEFETPKVMVRDSELLTRNETPFAVLDYDIYEQMALPERK